MEITERIRRHYDSFNSTQRRIGDYIVNHVDVCCFVTLKQLAAATNTTEATIISFSRKIKFSGFADMKAAVQASIAQQISPNEKIETSISNIKHLNDLEQDILDSEVGALTKTYAEINKKQLIKAAGLIDGAKRVYLIAYDFAATVSNVFAERFVRLGVDAVNLGGMDTASVLYRLAMSTQDDLIVVFSYKPYTQLSFELAKFLKKEYETKIVCFSDNESSPMMHKADVILLSPTVNPVFSNSMTAPFSLINLLATMYISKHKNNYRIFNKKLSELQRMVEKIETK